MEALVSSFAALQDNPLPNSPAEEEGMGDPKVVCPVVLSADS